MLTGYDDVALPLMIGVGAPYYVHSTFPVHVPSDMKGKKIRASGKMQQALAQAFDSAPIGMPVHGVAEAMSRGILDAALGEWNSIRTLKVDEIAKNHCIIPLGSLSFATIMNKESFARLPKEGQDILMNNREWITDYWSSARMKT
jgi:TRAP-type C4-dicarboxylate transport system substrate-binding protein